MRDVEAAASAPRRLGIVVVGSGFIAESHIAALRRRDDAYLAGVVDIDHGRAAESAYRNGGVRFATDLAEALRWEDADACIVCTPNATHRALALPIAAAGKHLMIEKPLATTVADAVTIADAFAAAGTVLQVGHTHRFYDYGIAVKDLIDGGSIGDPVLLRLAIIGGWIWPDWRHWVLDPQKSGGHGLHNGVHLLDLVTWWMGAEPVGVFARGAKQTSHGLEISDVLEMTVRYADGSLAACEMSRGHRPVSLTERDVLVVGTLGSAAMPWTADAAQLITDRGHETVPALGGDGFARQLDAWLTAVRTGEQVVTPKDAVRAVVLGVAVGESIATGLEVSIHLPTVRTGGTR
jgi:predicted dehydrogenase